MNRAFQGYRCTVCQKFYTPQRDLMTCPSCGGILEVEYDYDLLKEAIDVDYFKNNPDRSMFRYLPLISVHEPDSKDFLRVGWTPLYRSLNLKKELGLEELYIKDEGINPSGSLKDRASAIAVLKAKEGKHEVISCSSTGNAASSLAAQAARAGLKTVIFVPKRAPVGKVNQLLVYGARVISVDGDYRAAFELSKRAIETYGWYDRNAAINPHLVEGKKTVAYEIGEQLAFQPTDWVAVSVGDGCTLAGIYKGFHDFAKLGLIDRIPRLLAVQSEGCAPLYEAARNKKPPRPTEENTLADSIAVGIPRNPIKALSAVIESNGRWITVTDEAILKAMKRLGRTEGIFGEPAATATLAGIEKALEEGIIRPDETVTYVMTGNGLKDPKNADKAVDHPVLMKPSFSELERYLKDKGDIPDVSSTLWPDL
ncbi:MAG: threonine synthase [Acholeplasmataceae bacterium]